MSAASTSCPRRSRRRCSRIPTSANAAVLGVPDERMGEALAAYVSPRPGAELSAMDLIAFTRSRIAGYKVPYAIEILPELPLLPSGKPDRKALSR